MAAKAGPAPVKVSAPKQRYISPGRNQGAVPGKPTPQKPSTVKAPKAAAPHQPTGHWKGGSWNPKTGAAEPPAANGKNAAIAAAKSHAAAAVSTDPLAPLSAAQIKQQAKNTIGAAYKSSFGDVNSQAKQDAAINAKRAQDNTTYENWVASQTSGILAQGSAADANFATALGASNQALAAAAPNSAALEQAADQRSGNVSDNSTSTPLGQGVVQNTAKDDAHAAIGSTLDLSNIKDSGDLLRSTGINTEARVGETIQKQQADYNTALTALAQQRSKLQLSKAGDTAKEIARLQGVEIQKAQTAQNYALAQTTLGANVANQTAQNANARAQINASVKIAGIDAKKYFAGLNNARAIAKYEQLGENGRAKLSSETSLTESQQREALGNKNYLLDVQKVGIAKASVIWKENHPNASNSNPGGSPETANEQNELYSKIDTTRGTINGLLAVHNAPGGDTDVYQALANGTPIQVGTRTLANGKTEPVMKTYPPVPTAILNAAFDLSSSRSGSLPPDVVSKLRAIGLRNVSSHYRTS